MKVKQRSKEEIFKGCKQAKYIPILKNRIKYSRFLYKSNKHSDEYMSNHLTYKRYLKTHKIKGNKIFEPFYGDGSFKKAFKLNGIKAIGKKNSDCWDMFYHKTYYNLYIVSNIPFSFKYQIMHTLLEQKRNCSLVLPERTVINNILPKFKEAYGGKYSVFKMKGKENIYMCKNTNELARVNTVIVTWKF
jgi:hypothetical protein